MKRRTLLQVSGLLFGLPATSSALRALAALPFTAGEVATVFTPAEARTVELLCDLVIPPTDTPGAVAAGVPQFIAQVVAEWYTPRERQIFFAGLAALDEIARKQAGRPFAEADDETQRAALAELARAAADYQPPASPRGFGPAPVDEDSPFFVKLRELVVLGYYTSEVGATQELIYVPMPGRFDGEVDFAEVGRQWTS
ncbi:MAG: hypothetical protein KatS3mg124_1769 [Porticoccaceae bacterium]|nr:MAG: hypothetical protein KatS3mg124_1769 [Porticoccaceae bacterium]